MIEIVNEPSEVGARPRFGSEPELSPAAQAGGKDAPTFALIATILTFNTCVQTYYAASKVRMRVECAASH
jgi:hypothetical protein